MKTTLKTLSFIFFISLMFFACSICSMAGKVASTQTKDIQLLTDDDKVINVSIEDIRRRILKGEPVHFVKEQDEAKRTIKAEWITTALKKEYDVEKIDIKNAIITSDLDFHIKDNLVNIGASGIEAEDIKQLKRNDVEKVFIIYSSINIENCQIQGNLGAGKDMDFTSIIKFNESVDFSGSTVRMGVLLGYARFSADANFQNSKFSGDANFQNSKFSGDANFSKSSFSADAIFQYSEFPKGAYFLSSKFSGDADFMGSRFSKHADFDHTSFSKKTTFVNSSFSGDAYFHSCKFSGDVVFYNSRFSGDADFSLCTFLNEVIFDYIKFKEDCDFSGSVFTDHVDLRRTNYKIIRISWSQIKNLLDFPLSNKSLSSNKVKGILDILKEQEITEENVIQEEEKIKLSSFVQWQEVYLKLIKNFEYIGDSESANNCYYHYRKIKPKFKIQQIENSSIKLQNYPEKVAFSEYLSNKLEYNKETKYLTFSGVITKDEKGTLLRVLKNEDDKKAIEILYRKMQNSPKYIVGRGFWQYTKEWWEYILFGLTCGYGVYPLRTLGVMGALIISFTIFYFIGCQNFPNKKYLIYEQGGRSLSDDKHLHYKLYNCFYFSVMTFTTVGYGDLHPQGGFKIAAMIEGFLGWMTMALFLVTLGNVWLR